MAIHIEHPESTEQIEAWAAIMLRLDDIRIGVDALRHGFEEDRDSLWSLKTSGSGTRRSRSA